MKRAEIKNIPLRMIKIENLKDREIIANDKGCFLLFSCLL